MKPGEKNEYPYTPARLVPNEKRPYIVYYAWDVNAKKLQRCRYFFTREGQPGPEPVDQNYFYKRHAEILKALGLYGLDYDLYSGSPQGPLHYIVTRKIFSGYSATAVTPLPTKRYVPPQA
ncbi:hypothetical protein [Fibrella forsythiae]|uniref:Uncharacterized protein n=1 Tax=Fibrella forsythiae TaxID=2817061 RepID=A0ABS3JAE2_9BACT|nr:hypothetical protein [Fibrella forsythiae]MBO0946972.1 hypothetical protein [Fibrella forsythiae]